MDEKTMLLTVFSYAMGTYVGMGQSHAGWERVGWTLFNGGIFFLTLKVLN